MTVKWNDSIRAKILAGATDGLGVFAGRIVESGNDSILNDPKTGVKYRNLPNQSSAPGESPANQSGDLVRSGHTRVNYEKHEAEAVWNAPEAAKMEYGTERIAPRPFARPALMKQSPNLKGDVNEGIRRRLG